jgi:ribosomal protein S18 acetylase RimI-like enzyme
MVTTEYAILGWDSNFFGFKVARIIPDTLDGESLAKILSQMKNDGIRLAYWPTDPSHKNTQDAAKYLGGFLADKKLTYETDLGRRIKKPTNYVIRNYNNPEPNAQLIRLAIQSGEYSRFKNDPSVGLGMFTELYTQWMRNSTNRKIADAVLVVLEADLLTGFVTVKKESDIGSIGLIAVDEKRRGNGIGTALVQAAHDWFASCGCKIAKVTTQENNKAARSLYEGFGYVLQRVQAIHHFWL